MNKYVTFISDDLFLKEVKKVFDAYASNEDLSKKPEEILFESKETIDQFKTLFDIYSNNFDLNDWRNYEIPRQHDKTASNRIGDFHQNILGHVDGWINLGKGHPSGMDLKKEDDSIWIELKNKYNTLNSSSLKSTRLKIEKLAQQYPNALIYWAYIVSHNYETFDKIWKYSEKNIVHEINPNIRNIAGKKVYTLVTNDESAFKQVFEAIPKAINDIREINYELNEIDQQVIDDYKNFFLKN